MLAAPEEGGRPSYGDSLLRINLAFQLMFGLVATLVHHWLGNNLLLGF